MDQARILIAFMALCLFVSGAMVLKLREHVGRRPRLLLLLVVGLWELSVCARAIDRYFIEPHSGPPRMLRVIIPFLLLLLWVVFSKHASAFAEKLSQRFLVGLQSFRIAMELLILALAREGMMPVEMTFHGRNFDMLVGITAAILAISCRLDDPKWAGRLVLWNVVSMGILLNTVITGILSAPGPQRMLMTEVPNRAPLLFPYILLPSLLVPIAFALHILSIKKARTTLRAQADSPDFS